MIAGKTVESFEDEEKASVLKKIVTLPTVLFWWVFPLQSKGANNGLFAFKYHTSYPLLTIKFNVF